jgi:phage gp29-like protein
MGIKGVVFQAGASLKAGAMADEVKGIYLSNGDFKPFDMESLGTEIATRQNAGASWGDIGLLWIDQLPDPDPILRKRGDDARVLADLSADDQVTTAMLSRKNRVLNAPQYGFRPGTPDGEKPTPEAQNVYDRFAQDLERISMRPLISAILDAPFYGMAALELMWKLGGDGWWHLADIIARPFHWFGFDAQNRPFFKGENTTANPRYLPEGKLVIVTHHATYDNPYGLRLLSRCLWPVAFKRGGLEFYAKFVERHGMPWVVGKATKGANAKDKRAMALDLSRMVRDCVAAIPAGAEVQLLAPANTSELLHERFIARQDKSISKLLMGQTLTIEMEGKNSQAAAATHEDVAEGLADADKVMVTDALNEITWLYTQVNAGRGVFAPLFSYEDPKDLQARADLDKKLYDMGVDWLPEHFQENYNLKPGEFVMRQETGLQETGLPPRQPPATLFSAPGASRIDAVAIRKAALPPGGYRARGAYLAEEAQDRLDAAIEKMLPEALKASAAFVTQLENVVKKAQSLDQLELALADLLAPHATPSELESLLARTMTAAAGLGASAVRAEAPTDEDSGDAAAARAEAGADNGEGGRGESFPPDGVWGDK